MRSSTLLLNQVMPELWDRSWRFPKKWYST